ASVSSVASCSKGWLPGVESLPRGVRQAFFELLTGPRHIGCVQDRRDHANARRAGCQDLVEPREGDAADGKPGNSDVSRGPPDIIERNRPGAWLGAGGVDRADRDVIRGDFEGATGLLRRVRAQTEFYLARAAGDFRGSGKAAVEEVFLSQVAGVSAELPGDGRVVVDHQANAGLAGDGKTAFAQAPELVRGRVSCAELHQIGAAVA